MACKAFRATNECFLENEKIKIEYSLNTGYFSFVNKVINETTVTRAFSSLEYQDSNGINHALNTSSGFYKRTCKAEKIEKKGAKLTLKNKGNNLYPDIVMELSIYPGKPYFEMRCKVINKTAKNIFIDKMGILTFSSKEASDLNLGVFHKDWVFYGQTLTSEESKPVDIWSDRANYHKFNYRGYYLVSIENHDTKKSFTAGFVTTKDQWGIIDLEMQGSNYFLGKLNIYCDLDNKELEKNDALQSEILYVNFIDGFKEGIDKYAGLTSKYMKPLQWEKSPTGWGTWDYFRRGFTEQSVMDNVKFLAENRDKLPVEYIQLDAGFEVTDGDWGEWNPERLPHGPKWMADQIKSYGFKPGLWLTPFMVSEKSKLYAQHPDWVIKNKNGEPVFLRGYATKKVYTLDPTRPEVQKWLTKLLKTLTYDYGFEYIKMDLVNMYVLGEGVYYNTNMTKMQAYRKGIEAVRKGMGNKLLQGGVFGPSIGVVQAMRIGPDIGGRWDWSRVDVHHGEHDDYPGPGNIVCSLTATINTSYMHKKFWINDPDYLIARQPGDKSMLTDEEAMAWVSTVGLSGGAAILADNMTTTRKDRLEMLAKALPVYENSAVPADFFEKEIPTIYSLAVKNKSEQWFSAGFYNYKEYVNTMEFDLSKLGLDTNKEYHLFDFWEKNYLGRRIPGKITFENMPPHSIKLLAIKEAKNVPQIISTDTHISQGGVEIKSSEFKDNKLVIEFNGEYKRKTGKIFIYIPKGYNVAASDNIRSSGEDVAILEADYLKGKEIIFFK